MSKFSRSLTKTMYVCFTFYARLKKQRNVANYTSTLGSSSYLQAQCGGPFDINWNSQWGGSTKIGKYFSTVDSLLTLTVTGDKSRFVFGKFKKYSLM